MKTHVPVTHIMTSQVISVDVSTPLTEVEDIMKKKHIRHLPVTRNNKIAGIITLSDLQRLSFTSTFAESESVTDDEVAVLNLLSLDQVMIHHPFTIQKSTTVGEAANILIKMEFHCLPVVDGDQMVGIVTSTDLLKYFIE